jgi:hypothetical protein
MAHRISDVASIPWLISPAISPVSDIDVTEVLRGFVLDDESDDDPTPRPGSPTIVITPPSTPLRLSQRRRQLSSPVITPTTPRPRLRRKAATAPLGALHIYSGTKPQPPRRAISARTKSPFQTSRSQYRRTPVMAQPAPRLPVSGASTSRSRNSQRKSGRRVVGKMGSRQGHNSGRSQPKKTFQRLSEALSDQGTSFSEKVRVRETWKTKKMEVLQTQPGYIQTKDLPRTPSSMVSTPRELYGPINSNQPSPSATVALHIGRPQLSASVRRSTHFSVPLTPIAQRRASPNKRDRIAPSEAARQRVVYLPGPIELEEKTVMSPRKGSIATMEPFNPGTAPKAKRFSDIVALDGVVMFFEDMGIWEAATDACLDRYWMEKRTSHHTLAPRRAAPPAPIVPSKAVLSGSSGFFSPKRALQHEDQSPASSPNTPGRQKGRLRQLLKSSRRKA